MMLKEMFLHGRLGCWHLNFSLPTRRVNRFFSCCFFIIFNSVLFSQFELATMLHCYDEFQKTRKILLAPPSTVCSIKQTVRSEWWLQKQQNRMNWMNILIIGVHFHLRETHVKLLFFSMFLVCSYDLLLCLLTEDLSWSRYLVDATVSVRSVILNI